MFKKRSKFDLSHMKDFTCDMGKLIPTMVQEVIPGDTMKVNTNAVVRLTPLLAPIMHKVDIYTHYYFVPNRLVWKDWETFITGGERGDDDSVFPTVESPAEGYASGTLWDYMGCPTNYKKDDGTSVTVGNFDVSALPFRAYNMIYNEWYRDQNLQDPIDISLDSGLDSTTSLTLLNRAWEKDYLTSALPTPQKGPEVLLPLGESAPITGIGVRNSTFSQTGAVTETDGGTVTYAGAKTSKSTTTDNEVWFEEDPNNPGSPNIRADLTEATAISINDLRRANKLQVWQEKNMRGGSRYVESLLSHFGVRSSDSRLQRPEYLGGGRSPIVVSEVLQTSSTDGTSPQGNMSGHGFSAQSMVPFKKSFEEHGYIIGITSVMPRTSYMQGSPRHMNRRTRYDYYWPEFADLGEQAVLKKEVFANSSDKDGVFGYQERFAEYRQQDSSVHGDFRGNLDFWNMARKFDDEPTLSGQFVECDATKRVFATTTEHSVYVQMQNSVEATRIIPKRGKPSL